MRILGPQDLLSAAVTVKDGVTDAADLLPRTLDLMERVEAVVRRGEDLLDRAEAMVAQGEALLARGEVVVAESELTREHVDAVADAAAATNARAAEVADRAERLVAVGERLLPGIEPLAAQALPIAQAVVGSVQRDEVLAMIGLIDRLPLALQRIDEIAPDVHQILDSVTDLSNAVQGLPGMGSLIRRGERKNDEEDGASS